MKKIFLFLTLLSLSVGQMWATDSQLYFEGWESHNNGGGTNNYGATAKTCGDFSFVYADAAGSGSPLTGSYHAILRNAKNTNQTCSLTSSELLDDSYEIHKVKWNCKGNANQTLTVKYSTNGTNWTQGYSAALTTSKEAKSFTLNVTGPIYLKFETTGNNSTKNHWDANIDDIEIEGEEISVTPSYTITAQSNNNTYGTASLDGSIITGAPSTCYEYASPAYTVYPSGKATVTQGTGNKINEFTVSGLTDNVTVTINFAEKAAGKTVNFNAGAGTYTGGSLTEDCAGAGITLPSATASGICKGWTTFAGWATEAVNDSATTSVTLYKANSKFYPTSNGQTLYAVYSKVKSGEGASWILSSSSPSAGDSIIVAYYTGSAYKYMKNSGCDNDDLTVTAGVATPIANGKFKVVAGASNGVSFQSGSNYMHLNSTNLNVTSNQTNADLNISAGTSANSFLVKRNNSGSLDRVLKWTGTNWTSSSTMSDACEVYFFKRTTSITYYVSDPNCCTELGQINGSVSLDQLDTPDPKRLKATWSWGDNPDMTGIATSWIHQIRKD